MEKKYDNGDLKCPPLDFYIAEPFVTSHEFMSVFTESREFALVF